MASAVQSCWSANAASRLSLTSYLTSWVRLSLSSSYRTRFLVFLSVIFSPALSLQLAAAWLIFSPASTRRFSKAVAFLFSTAFFLSSSTFSSVISSNRWSVSPTFLKSQNSLCIFVPHLYDLCSSRATCRAAFWPWVWHFFATLLEEGSLWTFPTFS